MSDGHYLNYLLLVCSIEMCVCMFWFSANSYTNNNNNNDNNNVVDDGEITNNGS